MTKLPLSVMMAYFEKPPNSLSCFDINDTAMSWYSWTRSPLERFAFSLIKVRKPMNHLTGFFFGSFVSKDYNLSNCDDMIQLP